MNQQVLKKGFTLIELLVVIAIIGILASVVLASLNTARDKGQDAKIQGSINNARANAELYWDNNSRQYGAGLCSDPTILIVDSAVTDAGSTMTCSPSINQYAIWAPMVTDASTYYCVDNNGFAGLVTTAPTGNQCQ